MMESFYDPKTKMTWYWEDGIWHDENQNWQPMTKEEWINFKNKILEQ